jgi:ribose 1,5-bisphosphokinase
VSKGTLYLVVGPSGVGKDTLIQGAKPKLPNEPNWVFPTRTITRPPESGDEAGGEAHTAVSEGEFTHLRETGKFVLHWQAHDLCYGIPMSIETDIAEGKNVVVNVSRQIIDQARVKFDPMVVILVTASKETLRERLLARGRETTADINERLAGTDINMPNGPDVTEVINDGTADEGIKKFLTALGLN